MKTHRDFGHLYDMRYFARHAISFVEGVTWEEFQNNTEKQFAVWKALTLVAEAARALQPETIEEYSHIELQSARNMRPKLVYSYRNIDFAILWDTVTRDIPVLESRLNDILET